MRHDARKQKICLSYSQLHNCMRKSKSTHLWTKWVGKSDKRKQTCIQEVAFICPKAVRSCGCGYHRFCNCFPRYSNEGRVTNITLPTGEVSGFHSNMERWSRVEVEASTRENFVTSTNLSAGDTIYTFRQGTALWRHVGKVAPEPPDIRSHQAVHVHTPTHLWFMGGGC